ncbi:MAG: hypothetical protein HQK49_19890 [Oligoflexia bacterium]|nr:hypothetical protein [Oligoflexia bacterium]
MIRNKIYLNNSIVLSKLLMFLMLLMLIVFSFFLAIKIYAQDDEKGNKLCQITEEINQENNKQSPMIVDGILNVMDEYLFDCNKVFSAINVDDIGNKIKLEDLSKKEQKVVRIIEEILSTERDYYKQMLQLNTGLKNVEWSMEKVIEKLTINPYEYLSFTNSLSEILNISNLFMSDFIEFIVNPNSNEKLLFFEENNLQYLTNNYSTYALASKMISEQMNSKPQIYEKIIDKKLLRLGDFMSLSIRPIQRLPRYVLFFKDLLKSIPRDACPQIYNNILTFNTKMQKVVDDMNTAVAIDELDKDLVKNRITKKWGKTSKIYKKIIVVDGDKDNKLIFLKNLNILRLLKNKKDQEEPIDVFIMNLRKKLSKDELEKILLSKDVKASYEYYLKNGVKNKK